jgi:hypothetical protein
MMKNEEKSRWEKKVKEREWIGCQLRLLGTSIGHAPYIYKEGVVLSPKGVETPSKMHQNMF